MEGQGLGEGDWDGLGFGREMKDWVVRVRAEGNGKGLLRSVLWYRVKDEICEECSFHALSNRVSLTGII